MASVFRFGLVGLLCLVGCPSTSHCDQQPNAARCLQETSLALSVDNVIVRVEPDTSVDVELSLERTGEWTNRGPVGVEAIELPAGIHMEAVSVPSSEPRAVATLQVDSNAAKGVFPLMVIAQPAETDVAAAEQALEVVVPGAPGEHDLTFNFDGQLSYTRPGEYYAPLFGAVDVAGRLWLLSYETESEQSKLMRLLPDGTFDEAFESKSQALWDDLGFEAPYDMQRLSDDRMVISAGFKDNADVAYNALLMLNHEAEPDSTFGDGRQARVDVLEHEPFGILLRRDDMHLKQRGTWASYSYSGELNTDFLENGSGYASHYYSKAVVRDDDSVLALTYTKSPDARIISETGFTMLPGSYDDLKTILADLHDRDIYDYKVRACIAEPDQAVVCCGYYRTKTTDGSSPPWHAYVFRLDAEANLDLTFGVDGFIRRTSSNGQINSAPSIAAYSDGRVLVGYEHQPDAQSVEYSVACYESDGQPCPDFGAGGDVIIVGMPGQMFVDKYARLWIWGTATSPTLPDDQTVIGITRLWL
ncbi:MAG: hypothetical protein H6715_04795 [Myxococcales bacterium]|nr:hypothetical protein [Myxococcales bacterium]MCB9708479.1 hypothetical protein [Myxococcales bacterium]